MHTLSIKMKGGNANREQKIEREKEKLRESARPVSLDKSTSKCIIRCQGNRTKETMEGTKGGDWRAMQREEQQRCPQWQLEKMLNPVNQND